MNGATRSAPLPGEHLAAEVSEFLLLVRPALSAVTGGGAVGPELAQRIVDLGTAIVADKGIEVAFRVTVLQAIAIVDQFTPEIEEEV